MQAGNVTLNQPTVGYGHLSKLLAAALTLGFAVVANQAIGPRGYGFLVLLPIAAVLGCALATRRSIEALLFGSLVGFVMLDPKNVFQKMIDTNIAVLSDDTTAWVITITFLVGGLIALLNFSGGTQAFGAWVGRHAKSRKQTLMATWFMGLVIVVDDYLNALAVSSSMKALCDKFRVSRQMLAYVVGSTCAPMCVLVPISTWAVFLVGLFEANEVFGEGQGFAGYLHIIPYIFYAWAAVLLVPLVGMGLIPAFGSMKSAEADAAHGVVTAPAEALEVRTVSNPKISNFVLPLAAFMAGTWYFDYNTLYGIVVQAGLSINGILKGWRQGLHRSVAFALGISAILLLLGYVLLQQLRFVENIEKDLRRTERKLKKLAMEDALTGLSNRRKLDSRLAREVASARRQSASLAVLMIDIDYFKKYNDRYGHEAGDECLRAIANALKLCLRRPADEIFRYGGEEFAVMLPDTGVEGAFQFAENIRTTVKGLSIPNDASELEYVTLSIGVTSRVPALEDTAATFLRSADAALYEAKNAGRNQVIREGF